MLETSGQDRVKTGTRRSQGKVRRATGSMQHTRENCFKYSWNNVAGTRLKTKPFSDFFEDFSLHLGRLPKFVAHVSRTPVTAPEALLKRCPP